MKKLAFFVIIISFMAVSVYAQSYTVDNVTGRVQRDAGGRMVDVSVGDVLTEDTVVRTAVGASLVLVRGNSSVTIPAGRNGRIEDLAAAITPVSVGVTRADTAAARTAGQVSTASARASVAVKAPSVAEEEE